MPKVTLKSVESVTLYQGQFIYPGTLKVLPEETGKMSGYTPVNCAVSESGGAECQLPLTAPAGTSGMAPKLSLGYNSQGSNGPLGVGWSLNGLSAITRCRAIQAQDGIDLRVECHNCLLNPTSAFKS